MGNSEVGHMNLGAGRTIYQDLVKINMACEEHKLLQNKEIAAAFENVKKNGGKLHLMGLCSHGGVHSSLDHVYEFLAEAKRYGLENVFVHCFMDGRDTDPHSGLGFVKELEEKMAAAFIAGNAQDVCQVNWNWLYNYSADGSKFVDLNTTSKFIDLTQWDAAAMDACYVANSQQCVPVSMTGRIFYWNMTTFNKAGITEVPKSLDDLMAAGKAFQEKLGNDYYPMHLGAYDRMILMVFYLESKYGKDWADPVTSTLNYTEEEIAEGLAFIKSLVDNHVMMNLKTYYSANSDTATHQSNEWITGKIAGIFEWDSAFFAGQVLLGLK